MTDRSERPNVMPVCPFCGGEVEIGCLMGTDSLLFAFQWYEGDPSFWKNLFPHGCQNFYISRIKERTKLLTVNGIRESMLSHDIAISIEFCFYR